jgi:hypothetical protein
LVFAEPPLPVNEFTQKFLQIIFQIFLMLTENEISYLVRGACFKISKTLGPGLLESVYESALAYELRQKECNVKQQIPIPAHAIKRFLRISAWSARKGFGLYVLSWPTHGVLNEVVG